MKNEWIDTTIQTIPQVGRVVRNLAPTWHLAHAGALDDAFIAEHGIRGITWDVDGTLMEYHAMDIAAEFRTRLRDAFVSGPIRHAILSNCDETRFVELGEIFPEIPVVRGYHTSDGPIFRTMHEHQDTHSPDEAREILANGGRQIRKPDGRLIRHAAEILELTPPDLVMVGDQYFTDIAEANMGGARSVKVPTYRRDTFPGTIRFTQRLERMIYLATSPLHRAPAR